MTSQDRFLSGYLPYVLRRADQALSDPFYEVLAEYGIARSEWRALAVLHEFGDLGVVELASTALSPQPTITHALRRLEKRAFITRAPGTTDKRQRIVSLTASGKKLTKTLMVEALRLEAEALEEFGEVADLVHQLQTLINAAEARRQETHRQETRRQEKGAAHAG